MLLDIEPAMPTDDNFSRNFIDGRWVFPAAPYEFEIRNPADSTISAVVPLSSRNDVSRAVAAARHSQESEWADAQQRGQLLEALLDRLTELEPELARLQCTETGLDIDDSAATLRASLRMARDLVDNTAGDVSRPGVAGYVLAWGLPMTEMLISVVGSLARGMSAVVKPSLRGPLSPVAVALAASHVGFPSGVLNVVHGTGVDVGAALMSTPLLDQLYVHGNEDTLCRARRAAPRTGVAVSTLSAGGNAAIVYPDIDQSQIAAMVPKTAAALRIHSTGGMFGQTMVAVHHSVEKMVLESLIPTLSSVVPAPLPSGALRRRAMDRLDLLCSRGARVLAGGSIPDDVVHRMGWRIPPTIVHIGDASRAAGLLASVGEPLGPILTIVRWATNEDLDRLFAAQRYRDGYGTTWGNGFDDSRIRFGTLARAQSPLDMACNGLLPVAWSGK
jgi:acyl-CoA reductase-like NAD-dependent aldehyde dehydrogenase